MLFVALGFIKMNDKQEKTHTKTKDRKKTIFPKMAKMAECAGGLGLQQELWLDRLPPEVMNRIMAQLVSYARTEKVSNRFDWLLDLAESGAGLRDAIMSTLLYTMRLDECGLRSERWAGVFLGDVRVVIFGETEREAAGQLSGKRETKLMGVLRAPTLRRAEVLDDPDVLQALGGNKGVRELRIDIGREEGYDGILETVKSMKLKKLELRCQIGDKKRTRCPFNEMICRHPAADALQMCCPSLPSLEIKCARRDHWNARLGYKDPVWRVLPTLSELREVTVTCRVPPEAVEGLRRVERVHIKCVLGAYETAIEVGDKVRTLHTLESLNARQVGGLGACSGLEDLSMYAEEGAEEGLAAMSEKVKRLRCVKVRWGRPQQWSGRGHGWNVARFMGMREGALLGLVRSSARLRDLEVDFVRVRMDEVRAVVKEMGPRLRKLGMSIFDQDEAPLERLALVLEDMARWNARAQVFHVEWSRADYEAMRRKVREAGVRADRVRLALERLRRTAVGIDTKFLEAWIDSFVGAE